MCKLAPWIIQLLPDAESVNGIAYEVLQLSNMEIIFNINKQLAKGRGAARTADVQTLKRSAYQWQGLGPLPIYNEDKSQWGFKNHETGLRLCPGLLDWSCERYAKLK